MDGFSLTIILLIVAVTSFFAGCLYTTAKVRKEVRHLEKQEKDFVTYGGYPD